MAEKMNLDFSKTKDGSAFNPKRKTEGEYIGTIISFTDGKSKSNNSMWVYGIALETDRRAVYPVYCLLDADSLWKLRNMMLAAGFKVPKKRMQIDGNRPVGKRIGVYLEDDEYEGKPKSVVASFFSPDDYSGPENEDDDQDEELPDDSEEEEFEEDEDGEADVPDDGEDEPDDEDGEDEEEEPEPPAKKKAAPAKKAPAKKAPGRAKRKPEPESEEDEEDEDEMDVDDL